MTVGLLLVWGVAIARGDGVIRSGSATIGGPLAEPDTAPEPQVLGSTTSMAAVPGSRSSDIGPGPTSTISAATTPATRRQVDQTGASVASSPSSTSTTSTGLPGASVHPYTTVLATTASPSSWSAGGDATGEGDTTTTTPPDIAP